MKKAAAKRRRMLFSSAALLVLAAAFLITVPAEASRTYSPPITAALEQPHLSQKMQEGITEKAERQAENRFRLFEDLSLPAHPLEWVLARKTASGVFDLAIGCKTGEIGCLVQNCSGPSFQGLWTDPTTGLSYARNRWYDARTASWLSEDPMGAVDSPNLYAFVGWAPHMGRDPVGLMVDAPNTMTGSAFGPLPQMVGGPIDVPAFPEAEKEITIRQLPSIRRDYMVGHSDIRGGCHDRS